MINHDWISNVLHCIDHRAFIAKAKGDRKRASRKLEAGFLLDPFLFLLNSFRRP